MWDLPGPGIKPMFPALTCGFSPLSHQASPVLFFKKNIYLFIWLYPVLVAALEIVSLHWGMWDLF